MLSLERRLSLMLILGTVMLVGVTPVMAQNEQCADFSSQAAAQAFYEASGSHDPRLDADSDGWACEYLPAPYAEGFNWTQADEATALPKTGHAGVLATTIVLDSGWLLAMSIGLGVILLLGGYTARRTIQL